MLRFFYAISLWAVSALLLAEGEAESPYWMDGSQRLPLNQEVGLAADFLNDEFELQNTAGLAGVFQEYPAVVIYHLAADSLDATRQFFNNADPALSPVYTDVGGGLQALPGGIILVFTGSTDATTMEDFLANHGLTSKATKAAWHPRAFVVATPPGLPSLQLANRFANHDVVAISSPDWWTNIYTNR